ncbi:hypothetical protein D3C86_713570 [compost metagenome]
MEQRDDTARAAKHIAKPHHGKPRRILALRQRLQDQFSQAFGGSHDIGRTYGLVGGDQHEIANPGGNGGASQRQGAQGVGRDAFGHVLLHHGYVLVGGGVIDGLDLMLRDAVQAVGIVAHGAQRGDQFNGSLSDQMDQFLFDRVERGFRHFIQDEPGGIQGDDLAAEFRADRATCAGHHDVAAGDTAAQQVRHGGNRIPPKQVFDPDIAQSQAVGVDQFAQAGHQPDAQAVLFGRFHDFA